MSARSLVLPLELVDLVGQYLINDFAFGTCAALNVVSKAVHKATLKTLWTNMCWIPYQDGGSYNKEEIEKKWKVFKKSKGVKHVKFMIEPSLFKSATGYGEQPIISKSLAKTLHAAISLDPRRSSSGIEMHLFKGYGYSYSDLTRIQSALNMVHGIPGFAAMEEVEIYVHAKPAGAAKEVAPKTSNGAGGTVSEVGKTVGETTQQVMANPVERFQSGWLSDIVLNMGKSVRLDGNDCDTLMAHFVKFLHPYTENRIKDDDPEDPGSLIMSDLKPAAAVSFPSAIVKLYDIDQYSAMIGFNLYIAYNEETGKPMPTRAQMSELERLLQQAKNGVIRGANTFPLALLGGFHSSNMRETVVVDVSVDPERKLLRTMFGYGYDDFEREEVRLTDVRDLKA